MGNRLSKLICIVGPTASGKTVLAIKLAKKINGEIISADSRQIYREMDIGTAKPPIAPHGKDGRGDVTSFGIPHYLIDIRNPNQIYTAGQFKRDAARAVKQIIRSGKLPLLVGGTGLYISAIVNNLEIPEVKPNRQLRKKLEQQIQKHGLYYVYGKLTALDPEAAYNIDPKNPRRIIRAYEIALATKKPFSETRKKGEPLFDILILGLNCGEKLKTKIAKRTNLMIKKGLIKETKNLITKYGPRPVPFDAIGYRESIQYLRGKTTLPETVALINKNTWRFAKRQLTWFRKMPVVWVKNQSLAEAEKEIKRFLKN